MRILTLVRQVLDAQESVKITGDAVDLDGRRSPVPPPIDPKQLPDPLAAPALESHRDVEVSAEAEKDRVV